MADTTIDYGVVLADMEAKRAALDSAIAGIRQWLSLGGGEEGQPSPQTLRPSVNEKSGDSVEIRFDTFFGMSMPDAIRKYLAMMKQPRSVSEITNAIKQGGLPTTAKNLINSVGSTLSRMKSEGEVVQVHGKWGLKEWYPGWKETLAKPKTKNRKRARKTAKPQVERSAVTLTSEQIERAKALQAAGKKLGEIAKELGVHHFTVLRVLKPTNDKRASA